VCERHGYACTFSNGKFLLPYANCTVLARHLCYPLRRNVRKRSREKCTGNGTPAHRFSICEFLSARSNIVGEISTKVRMVIELPGILRSTN
jgi:hypothetical protein